MGKGDKARRPRQDGKRIITAIMGKFFMVELLFCRGGGGRSVGLVKICMMLVCSFYAISPIAFLFSQSMVGLACDLRLDSTELCSDTNKWAWFHQYCMAARMAKALQQRTSIPPE